MNQNSNMEIWNRVRSVPSSAVTEITGGPLKGKSNINGTWRLEELTRQFGVCGLGWTLSQKNRWTEKTANGDTAVFVEVELRVRVNGQLSEPIFGTGGNTLIRTSTEWVNGQMVTIQRIDDEAYKKAFTDAISVACKSLGFAADIYYSQDETKYGSFHQEITTPQVTAEKATDATAQWPWTAGFKEIAPSATNWKASVTQVSKMADLSREQILGRISAKFNITQENFNKLLIAANRQVS